MRGPYNEDMLDKQEMPSIHGDRMDELDLRNMFPFNVFEPTPQPMPTGLPRIQPDQLQRLRDLLKGR